MQQRILGIGNAI